MNVHELKRLGHEESKENSKFHNDVFSALNGHVVIHVTTNKNITKIKSKMAMAKHICDVIEKVRGKRPTYSNSFASIGVDSLGAVMFIKYLSDSVGGLRIEPSKIYAPGVTIR